MTRSHTPSTHLCLTALLALAAGCQGATAPAPAPPAALAPLLGPGVPAPALDEHALEPAVPWEVVRPHPPEVQAKIMERWAAHRGDRDTGITTVYLVFDGITITRGNDSNALTNTSWIPPSTVAMPAFDASYWSSDGTRAQVIQKIVDRLGQVYAGYHIQFVTSRPSSGNYMMTVMGGTAATIGQQYGVLGVSPLDCQPGEILNPNPVDINFICTDDIGGTFNMSLWDVVYTTAHEIAHTFGLAHINRQQDIMYWATAGGATLTWGAASTRAGESNCSTNNYQDDALYLTKSIGGSSGTHETTPPTVAITSPANNSTTGGTAFDVTVTASDASGIKYVDLYLDGTLDNRIAGNGPWVFGLLGVPAGAHQLQAKAADWWDNVGTSSVITVTVPGGPVLGCQVDADCGANRRCVSNTCVDAPPPLTGGIGADCQANTDCASGVCVSDVQNYCTQPCNDAQGITCPSGYDCQNGFCIADGIPPGATGSPCSGNTDCRTGLCADAGPNGFCTEVCQPSGAACPNRGECVDSGDHATFICGPTPSDVPPANGGGASGGCAAAPRSPPAGVPLAAVALILALRRRRRGG
jgi:MYXO-CTERM domain-containing protein